jgi:hypothetical protein
VLPPLFIVAAGLVHVAVFGARIDPEAINPLWFYPIAVVVVSFVGGGQEELGWRAFALPALQTRFSARPPVWRSAWSGRSGTSHCFCFRRADRATCRPVPAWSPHSQSQSSSCGSTTPREACSFRCCFTAASTPSRRTFRLAGVDAVGTLTGYGSNALVLLGAVGVLLGIYGPGQLADRPRVTLSDLLTTDSETTR